MRRIAFPKYDLSLEERDNGVQVEQHGRSYLALKWWLNDQVANVVRQALAHGLTCLWQEGHPSRPTSKHISFSFTHKRASWIFCIGDGDGAPNVNRFTVSQQRCRKIARLENLQANWECGGGKNFTVPLDRLPDFLNCLDECGVGQLEALPPVQRRGRLARAAGFQIEVDLEDCLANVLSKYLGGGDRFFRQRRFASNVFSHQHDIPDFIIETPKRAIVCELKLNRGREPELAQLCRYMANPAIVNEFNCRSIHGILVAAEFDMAVKAAAAAKSVSLYSYTDGTGVPLRLIQGADVLAPFFTKRNK
ncbi:MAG TPA: hypothetical protein VHC42_06155 [Rhizomicrobium sp.]|nr:hypothetical protein [Rhizomicrobium sp.]